MAAEEPITNEQASANIGRREFLRQGAATASAAAMLGVACAAAPAETGSSKPIRVGVIGTGPRGRWHITHLLTNHPVVTVPAVCDIQEDRLRAAIEIVKKLHGTTAVRLRTPAPRMRGGPHARFGPHPP